MTEEAVCIGVDVAKGTLDLAVSNSTETRQFENNHEGITNAASYIAGLLRGWGYAVTEGIGKTGVVASLKVGNGKRAIGLRADTDALAVQEMNDSEHKSTVEGKSHTGGHDGHSAMLLGAAKHLARTLNFSGTVHLIFQPAEEVMGGAPAMIAPS